MSGQLEFFNKWTLLGQRNQAIFEDVFAILPSNRVKTMPHHGFLSRFDTNSDDFISWQRRYDNRMELTDPEKALERIKELKGYLVTFPLQFLENEATITDFHSFLKTFSLFGLLGVFVSQPFK